MDKYQELESKLKKIINYLNQMNVRNDATAEYLTKYKEYVKKLIIATENHSLNIVNGAALGLVRGISDYDELCSDEILWQLVVDADNFFIEK